MTTDINRVDGSSDQVSIRGTILGSDGAPMKLVSDRRTGESLDQGAVIYLKEHPKTFTPHRRTTSCAIRIQDGRFVPSFTAAAVGQKVEVSGGDSDVHSIDVSSPSFARGRVEGPHHGPVVFEYTFKEPQRMLLMQCHIHATEKAYLSIVPNGCYCFPDQHGSYNLSLGKAVKGQFVIEVTAPGSGSRQRAIELDPGAGDVVIDFDFSQR